MTRDLIYSIAVEGYGVRGLFNDEQLKRDIYSLYISRKMIARFLKTGQINEKLLLNNIVISINTFGADKVNRMFRAILSDDEFGVLKSMLRFLGCYRLWEEEVESNRIIDDILRDTAIRYNLEQSHV